MQTIQKRKQWALIALALIATLTLQLFAPITAHAEETERTLDFTTKVVVPYSSESAEGIPVLFYSTQNSVVKGSGNFVIKSYRYAIREKEEDYYTEYTSFILSDEPFTFHEISDSNGTITECERVNMEYNGIYYNSIGSYSLPSRDGVYETSGFINMSEITQYGGYQIKEDIDNGVIDLTKDDYKDLVFNESTATYDANLDFASLGAKSNSAWTVSKGDDGYTLTTPSTAGVNIYWTNKQYVKNSYVKICFNGKYYKKLLDIKYVDGAISLSGEGVSSSVEYDKIDRSSNSVFFLYNDILSDCIKQNNYNGGYSFVIDNIQLQCYAEIDGIVKKSRVYKIDFNLLRENGTTDTVFNDASNVTYSTTDSVLGDFTTAYDDLEFVADIDADKPIYEYDEVETNSFIKFFKWFYEMLQGITNSLGQFPQLLTSVFGFLPKEVTIIIGLALGAVVILRFLGR